MDNYDYDRNYGRQNGPEYGGNYNYGNGPEYNGNYNYSNDNYGYQECPKIGGFCEADIRAYVGEKHADDYIHIFRRLERGEKPYRLLAGLFPGLVLAYRKMWKEALIIEAATVLLQKICAALGLFTTGIYTIAMLAFFFLYIAREYNGWYWMKVRQDLEAMGLRDRPQPSYDLHPQLRQKGSPSVLNVILMFLVSNVYNSIVGAIFGV